MQKLLTYLQEGFYIGANTSTVQVEFLTYNPEEKFYALVTIDFEFEKSGNLAFESKVKIIQNKAYDFDYESTSRVVAEVIFLLLYLFQIAIEFYELKKFGHNWPQYFLTYSNLLDITSLGAFVADAYMHARTHNG